MDVNNDFTGLFTVLAYVVMSLTHILFSFLVDAVIKIPKSSMRSWPENRRFLFYLNWMHD